MFNDVDDSLRALLVADVPLDPATVDISFERPTREWSSRLTRPTLNLFLSDIRERTELRDQNLKVQPQPNGRAVMKRGDRRIDLTYAITAWTNDPGDEHRILAATLACMFRVGQIPEEHLQGALPNSEYDVLLRIMPPDHHIAPADLWSVLDNEMRTSLTWVATAPLDAFAAFEGPLVRTTEFGYGTRHEEWRERFLHIAGEVRSSKADGELVPGAEVEIVGTAFRATTDEKGKFSFPGVRPDTYTWRVSVEGGKPKEVSLDVPSEDYTLTV